MVPRKALRVPLRIVFYKESGSWIAHCLEFDLIGDGESKVAALERLSEAIALQIEASTEHKNYANLFAPADGKFFEMYAAGRDVISGTLEITAIVDRLKLTSTVVEGVEAREYEDCEADMAEDWGRNGRSNVILGHSGRFIPSPMIRV